MTAFLISSLLLLSLLVGCAHVQSECSAASGCTPVRQERQRQPDQHQVVLDVEAILTGMKRAAANH